MQKSLKSPDYARLIATLVAVRHASGVRQQALAKKLIDLIEFIAIVRALDADPVKIFRDFVAGKAPPRGSRKRTAV
jgi:hypothetical protein